MAHLNGKGFRAAVRLQIHRERDIGIASNCVPQAALATATATAAAAKSNSTTRWLSKTCHAVSPKISYICSCNIENLPHKYSHDMVEKKIEDRKKSTYKQIELGVHGRVYRISGCLALWLQLWTRGHVACGMRHGCTVA